MRISVVIPTYDRPGDLRELLYSIKRQTIKPLEVIIVDDTPSLVIKDLCDEMSDKLRKAGISTVYLKNPKRRSTATARNMGAEIARGDIILFLDSDVILYKDYIENIVKVFEEHPYALGVQGFEVRKRTKKFSLLIRSWHKIQRDIFFLSIPTQDSCRLFEYPVILTRIIKCEWLAGSNMAWKKEVFSEFSFDENLGGYAYMEDVLFSHQIFRRNPNGLLITPYAKCIHKLSKKARMEKREFNKYEKECRKYVLAKLFGLKGLYMYAMQNLGGLIISSVKKITKI